MEKHYIGILMTTMFCLVSMPAHAVFVALQGRTFFTQRSQGTDTAREMVSWQRFTNPSSSDTWYGTASVVLDYERSFRLQRIAEYYFGTNVLSIQGSQVPARSEVALLADYFGLSPAFSSNVTVEPRLQNLVADFSWYGGYHSWYGKIHLPVVWTTAGMDLKETVNFSGNTTPFPARYMSADALQAPFTCFTQAMQGNTAYGQIEGLRYGKIAGEQVQKGIADMSIALGWYPVYNERGYLGISLNGGIPMGTRPTSEFIFEPIVGNGRHPAFGFGCMAGTLVWEKDTEQRLDVLFDANVTHLFSTTQCRSFDLVGTGTYQRVGNWGSRYVLAKKFTPAGAYSDISLPLINVTTLPCKVRVDFQLDASIALSYLYKTFAFEFGYNGWVRSHEKISCPDFPDNTYGLKGIQNVVTTIGNLPSETTQSKASINGNPFSEQAALADDPSPMFITQRDLNIHAAQAPLSFTHKLFWHLYRITDPVLFTGNIYYGLGGFVEFEGIRPKCVQTNHDSLSKWGAWFKLGVAYS